VIKVGATCIHTYTHIHNNTYIHTYGHIHYTHTHTHTHTPHRRECEALEKNESAPYDQILEYRCWISRLEAAGDDPALASELRRTELRSETEELRERIDSLSETLRILQGMMMHVPAVCMCACVCVCACLCACGCVIRVCL
jgi:hypothetical protein